MKLLPDTHDYTLTLRKMNYIERLNFKVTPRIHCCYISRTEPQQKKTLCFRRHLLGCPIR